MNHFFFHTCRLMFFVRFVQWWYPEASFFFGELLGISDLNPFSSQIRLFVGFLKFALIENHCTKEPIKLSVAFNYRDYRPNKSLSYITPVGLMIVLFISIPFMFLYIPIIGHYVPVLKELLTGSQWNKFYGLH